jgi:two-component system response regulator DesR
VLADPPRGNHRTDHVRPTGGAPSVGVVAPGPGGRTLAAMLERAGLDAAAWDTIPRSRKLDVLVLAVESPASGETEIHRAQATRRFGRLVLVVGKATPAEARQLLVEDVCGLVLERHAESTLALAVRATFAGQICYPRELMPTQLRAGLSNREKQILAMVVLGFSNPEIAGKLHVSESTVKSHLHSAFATIGVRSRKDAVALILDPSAGFGAGILAITDAGLRENSGL